MRLLDLVKSCAGYLEKAGIDDPLADAEVLVYEAAGIDRLRAYLDNPEVDEGLVRKVDEVVARRVRGEPVQYILGHVDFLGLRIEVGRGVLIPRPETELLVQEAAKEIRAMRPSGERVFPRILDLCTGSGCIALALAQEFPGGDICATDASEEALSYARRNADLNAVRNVTFLCGSLYEPLRHMEEFDLIISNPPYIRTADINSLQREIREWEPREALDGGKDGLDLYRRILLEGGRYLAGPGMIILELGYDQAAGVADLARRSGFGRITVIKDYAGHDRIMKIERQEGPGNQSSHLQG